jgi:serine/threonine-protein kinase HipA
MIFNILIGNVDDHLRNHGFLMTDAPGQYRLSPAFDLLPHLDSSYMPQSIGVGALGAASTLTNALTQCERFFLEKSGAKQIISEVRDAVANWRAVFLDSGVSRTDIHQLAACFSAADDAERISAQVLSREDESDSPTPKST